MGVNMKRNDTFSTNEKLQFGVVVKILQLSSPYLDSLLSEALFSVGGKVSKIFVFVKYRTFNLP